MTNDLKFIGQLIDAIRPAPWMIKPKEYPDEYKSYQVYIRMRDGRIYISDSLTNGHLLTSGQHENARDRPMNCFMLIDDLVYLKTGSSYMYYPESPPDENVDRMFITMKNTALIYTAVIVHMVVDRPYGIVVNPLHPRPTVSEHLREIRRQVYRQ